MFKNSISLLILIVLLVACNSQPSSKDGIEVIVFSWDAPMRAGIPEIHIWKDGRAVWVEYGADGPLHVYETLLSSDEILQVHRVLTDSGFWEEEDQGWISPGSTANTIWANSSGKQKSVNVRGSKFEAIIPPLHNILEASPDKSEYFPEGAYLFVGKERFFISGFTWPDEEVSFDFSSAATATEGIYIDGKMLSVIWEIVQAKESWIISNNISYYFYLKIPGVSCVFGYDGSKHTCEMYKVQTP